MPATALPRPGVVGDAPAQDIEPVAVLPLGWLPMGPHATPPRWTGTAVPVRVLLSLGARGQRASAWHGPGTGRHA